jgi:hypothetical protein
MGPVGLQVVRSMGNREEIIFSMRKLKRFLFLALLWLAGPSFGANVSEYSVKADYLSYFAEYVKWPRNTFAEKTSPIVLGVLGDDPFGKTLDEAVKGKMVAGHNLEVRRFRSFEKDQMEGLKDCQILFISVSEQDKVREILSGLKDTHLLTVSEIDQFPMIGGIIQFVQEGDNIGLALNPKKAVVAGLKLSSQLMMNAKLIMEVDAVKAKSLYYDGIQLYVNGDLKAAIKKWKECLQEDPGNIAAQENISKAKAKLKAISSIK